MTRKLRVKAYSRLQRNPPGYVGSEWIYFQRLQEKRWWGWKTIDEEIIPTDVKISLATTGFDTWKSKFAKYGSFGRDGIIK